MDLLPAEFKMNNSVVQKIGFLAIPPYIEYQASDKRNRNPNWTDNEITRFLTILMEEAVLQDLNAQRNKQVFLYVSQKMGSEGSEKSWDQCRVKLKNLKSQWRYVKERMPGIEIADLEDEDVTKQLTAESQACGVSPSCIKHLRLLKQFLNCLSAVRKGVSPPRYKHEPRVELHLGDHQARNFEDRRVVKVEYNDDDIDQDYLYNDNTEDGVESRLVVETNNSPPTSPVAVPDGGLAEGSSSRLKVISPSIINSTQARKRSAEAPPDDSGIKRSRAVESPCVRSPPRRSMSPPAESHPSLPQPNPSELMQSPSFRPAPGLGEVFRPRVEEDVRQGEAQRTPAVAGEAARGGEAAGSVGETVERFQRDMVDKYLQFQRESEMRFLSWEQERWRMEQSCMERWRSEHRQHEKEMFSMFCQLVAQCNQTIVNTVAQATSKK